MIAIGDRIWARGRLMTREGAGPSLGFWDGDDGWGADLVAPAEYPAVQLRTDGAPLDRPELAGRHVEVSGRWSGEGVVEVERLDAVDGPDSLGQGSQAFAAEQDGPARSARIASVEEQLFSSGDLIWRTVDLTESRATVIMRRGADAKELVAAWNEQEPGLDVQVHQSYWTPDELDRATAAIGALPEGLLYAAGRGLRDTDVAVTLSVLHEHPEVDALLEQFPAGLVEVEYLVRADSPVSAQS